MTNDNNMATENECHPVTEGYHLYTLIEHDFITGLQSGAINNISDCYIHFTKTVVSLYHRHHCKEEIRSAFHLVEDHLLIMLEDVEDLCDVIKKFLNRAINFIKKFVKHISDWFMSNKVNVEPSAKEEVREKDSEVFAWEAPFTELVELTDALLSDKKFGNIVNARFIKAFFGLLGVKKTPNDYYRALKKLQEKAPRNDEGTGRSKLLLSLLTNTEERWRKIYDGQ